MLLALFFQFGVRQSEGSIATTLCRSPFAWFAPGEWCSQSRQNQWDPNTKIVNNCPSCCLGRSLSYFYWQYHVTFHHVLIFSAFFAPFALSYHQLRGIHRQETIIRRQASILVELIQASQVAKPQVWLIFLTPNLIFRHFSDHFFPSICARPPLEFARHTFRSRACCP